MQKTFIAVLIIILIVVVFALQNSLPVKISFWFWEVNSDLSLVIFLAVTFGALVSFLLSLPYRAKKNKIIGEKDDKIRLLEEEILSLNKKVNQSGATNPDVKQGDHERNRR